MASSPSYCYQRVNQGGQPIGRKLEVPGWCQGVLIGDNAVEIPPRATHTESLLMGVPRLEEPTGAGTCRLTVSLRYHIHATTVVGDLDDPNARRIPDEAVWRGTVTSGPVAVALRRFDAAGPRTRRIWKEINASPPKSADGPIQQIYDIRDLEFNANVVAAYIKENLVPSTWDGESTYIGGRMGYVIALHHRTVQEGIAQLLADWRGQLKIRREDK
jgi:hypothetical protein